MLHTTEKIFTLPFLYKDFHASSIQSFTIHPKRYSLFSDKRYHIFVSFAESPELYSLILELKKNHDMEKRILAYAKALSNVK